MNYSNFSLVSIKDSQLPKEYSWDNFAAIFNSQPNLAKANRLLREPNQVFSGLTPTGFKERAHYEY